MPRWQFITAAVNHVYGLVLACSSDGTIYVSRIVPGTPARLCGAFSPGDQIVAVDSIAALTTLAGVVATLRAPGEHMLTVARPL